MARKRDELRADRDSLARQFAEVDLERMKLQQRIAKAKAVVHGKIIPPGWMDAGEVLRILEGDSAADRLAPRAESEK